MTESNHTPTHNDIMELLPWYATGALDDEESRMVADYLEKHPEYLSEVKLIQQLKIADEADLDIPAADTQRLMRKLEASLEKQPMRSRLKQWFLNLLTPSPLWAAVPAVLVLAVVLLWIPQQGSQKESYQTLSSGEQDADLRLSVITEIDASETAILPLLQQAVPDASIHPLKTGKYQVTFNEALPPDIVLKIMQKLQSINYVQEVKILPK